MWFGRAGREICRKSGEHHLVGAYMIACDTSQSGGMRNSRCSTLHKSSSAVRLRMYLSQDPYTYLVIRPDRE
jgi:hypothetical protein